MAADDTIHSVAKVAIGHRRDDYKDCPGRLTTRLRLCPTSCDGPWPPRQAA